MFELFTLHNMSGAIKLSHFHAVTKTYTKNKCQNVMGKTNLGNIRPLICNTKARKPQRKHPGLKRKNLSSKNHRPSQAVIYMQRQMKTGSRFVRIQKLSDSDSCVLFKQHIKADLQAQAI